MDEILLPDAIYEAMVAHAVVLWPEEACGLLAGRPGTSTVEVFYPCRNAAESSKVYSIAPLDYMEVEDQADAAGLAIIGVMHSHTHTDPYPSPTDVDQAFDPAFADSLPYNVAIVTLDEGPRLVTNVVECDNGDLRIGMRVSVHFEEVADGVTVARFAPESR